MSTSPMGANKPIEDIEATLLAATCERERESVICLLFLIPNNELGPLM